MKVIPEQKASRLSLKETQILITEIYGDAVFLHFDINCIAKYELFFEKGLPTTVCVVYNKIKATHADSTIGYWPIQLHQEEMNLEAGLKIIQGFLDGKKAS